MVTDQAAAEWRCPGFYYSLRFFSLFIFIHNSCPKTTCLIPGISKIGSSECFFQYANSSPAIDSGFPVCSSAGLLGKVRKTPTPRNGGGGAGNLHDSF